MESTVKEVRVIQKKIGCEPTVVPMKDDLETFQEAVGGNLGTLELGNNIYIFMDEDGISKGLKENIFIDIHVIKGDILIVKCDDEGESCDLNDNEIKRLLSTCNTINLDFKNNTINLGMLSYIISTEFSAKYSNLSHEECTDKFGYAINESLIHASNVELSTIIKRLCRDLNIKDNVVDEFVNNGGDLSVLATNLKFIIGNIILTNLVTYYNRK